MSQKIKLNAFQKKLLETIERGQAIAKLNGKNKDKEFESPCVNPHCPARNGKRHRALAWKSKQYYYVYCDICGSEDKLSKDEFKSISAIINKEEIDFQMSKKQIHVAPKKIVGDPADIENEYLDDEG